MRGKAYEYCISDIDKPETPKYVRKQMAEFMEMAEGKHPRYEINEGMLDTLEGLLRLLISPKGLKAGERYYDCATPYQWLAWTAVLCALDRETRQRRYQIAVLEIARQNYKTTTIAVLMLALMITEPAFGEFYSVAPDGQLSRRIKKMMEDILAASPLVANNGNSKRFKVLQHEIEFTAKHSSYKPLAYSTSNMDGRTPTAWVADEVGALRSEYPIEAMKSGQTNVKNKLGFIISTKYPTFDNPFEDAILYAKHVLDGIEDDPTWFSLLYEPDEAKDWESNDLMLKQANPCAAGEPTVWADLLKKRAYAISVDSARENFLTKHLNVIYHGMGTGSYLDLKEVQACRTTHIDWNGMDVWLGLDFSTTTDNTSVAMIGIAEDQVTVVADVFVFIPAGRIEEKTAAERVKYANLLGENVRACGDKVIDYLAVERFIEAIPRIYGVNVQGIGFDPWNARSTAQRLEAKGFNMIELKQHSSVLHPATKLLKEKILSKEFKYPPNKLLEINFQNAKCSYDTNLNAYVHKKKSRGKVDMVISLINAMALVEKEHFSNYTPFFAYTI